VRCIGNDGGEGVSKASWYIRNGLCIGTRGAWGWCICKWGFDGHIYEGEGWHHPEHTPSDS